MVSNIPIRRGRQLDAMRAAGECAAEILRESAAAVRPGATTGQIDRLAADLMEARGVRSAFHGYRGFPGHICISTNDEVVHGIGGSRVIQPGDIVKIDVGIVKDGWIGDNALTIPVPPVSEPLHRLLWATEEALHIAIGHATDGTMLGDLCHSIDHFVTAQGFRVVREFVGHGVGRRLHEEPQVPNFCRRGAHPRLREGMILAIEPMVNAGMAAIRVLDDKWTVVTRDGKPSAHFEHTVLVAKGQAEVLTPRPRLMPPPPAP
jgi:methionyl aminopeptidase